MKRDVLDDAVALVEDPEHRDALRHRRNVRLVGDRRRGLLRGGLIGLLGAAAARRQRQRDPQRCAQPGHAYSGIHGS
jgi:hypothetical protein